jgi:hypothetical protein
MYRDPHQYCIFQSSLLRYRQFQPDPETMRKGNKKKDKEVAPEPTPARPERRASRMRFSWLRSKKHPEGEAAVNAGSGSSQVDEPKPNGENSGKEEVLPKKMPVFFMDEAHKL